MNFNWVKIFLFLVFTNLFYLINSIMFMNLLYQEEIEFFEIYNDIEKDLLWSKYILDTSYLLRDNCRYIIATSDRKLISEFIYIVNNYKYERNNSKELDFLHQYKEKFVKLDIRPVKKKVCFSDENDEFKKFLSNGILCSERNEEGELILTKFYGFANCRNPEILHLNYLSKRIAENNICIVNHKIDLLIKSLTDKDKKDDLEDLKNRKKLEEKLQRLNEHKKNLAMIERAICSRIVFEDYN